MPKAGKPAVRVMRFFEKVTQSFTEVSRSFTKFFEKVTQSCTKVSRTCLTAVRVALIYF